MDRLVCGVHQKNFSVCDIFVLFVHTNNGVGFQCGAWDPFLQETCKFLRLCERLQVLVSSLLKLLSAVSCGATEIILKPKEMWAKLSSA